MGEILGGLPLLQTALLLATMYCWHYPLVAVGVLRIELGCQAAAEDRHISYTASACSRDVVAGHTRFVFVTCCGCVYLCLVALAAIASPQSGRLASLCLSGMAAHAAS
jgi:hypothetical protein